MKKYNANKEFTKALIYIMLKEPQKYYEYKDFQGIFTRSESDIRRSLRELISARILEVSKPRGKPPGLSKNQDKRKCYRISNKIRAFKELLKIYSDSEPDIGLFLNSKYINPHSALLTRGS